MMRTNLSIQSSLALRAVVAAALTAGVLDAVFFRHRLCVRAARILRRRGAAIHRERDRTSRLLRGLPAAALSVGIHFLLAFAFAGSYYAAAVRVPALRSRAISAGLLYGPAIWIVMDLIVLPLTGTPKSPFDAALFGSFLLDLALFVGLPIALLVRRWLRVS